MGRSKDDAQVELGEPPTALNRVARDIELITYVLPLHKSQREISFSIRGPAQTWLAHRPQHRTIGTQRRGSLAKVVIDLALNQALLPKTKT